MAKVEGRGAVSSAAVTAANICVVEELDTTALDAAVQEIIGKIAKVMQKTKKSVATVRFNVISATSKESAKDTLKLVVGGINDKGIAAYVTWDTEQQAGGRWCAYVILKREGFLAGWEKHLSHIRSLH